MAYDGTKLNLVAQGIGGVGKVYNYTSADATSLAGGASYFTDGSARGMALKDTVIVQESDNAYDQDVFPVEAVTVGGAADLGTAS